MSRYPIQMLTKTKPDALEHLMHLQLTSSMATCHLRPKIAKSINRFHYVQ